MKRILIGLCISLLSVVKSSGENCDLHIQVVCPSAEMCGGDAGVAKQLSNKLIRVLTMDGVTADDNYGQFYITGKFDDIYRETLPGPPTSTVVHTTLTLMVADLFGNKVFETESFDLRGVGTSVQRAYLNALSQVNADNAPLRKFINRAQKKVISYFDNNYQKLLQKANAAAKTHDYEQALYFAGLIPECSVGYAESERMLERYWHGYIDLEGVRLLNEAKRAFAISPNEYGATEAYSYINSIDPTSSSYGAAMKFAEEIKRQTKAEYDFEIHKKYEDKVNIQRSKIDAARQIGVAYGQGQKSTTTNILWK
ncbi:MAG: hypothetical protein K2H86_01480 [Muribaculaceae bacterium]|nr:hypothetical protein [Muribaculaceae bacterium]